MDLLVEGIHIVQKNLWDKPHGKSTKKDRSRKKITKISNVLFEIWSSQIFITLIY